MDDFIVSLEALIEGLDAARDGAATQTDDNTITVKATPDLTNGVWRSDKEVVIGLRYNSTTGELTVIKGYLVVQRIRNYLERKPLKIGINMETPTTRTIKVKQTS